MDTNQTPPQDQADNSAQVLLDLESTIKNHISMIDKNRIELKKIKEMLDSNLTNDPAYKEANDAAKAAAKVKGKAKANVMQLAANRELGVKIKEMSTETKELNNALSDYLREYQRMSGNNEIEGDDGEVREIVYVAKLVKKSKKFRD